MEEGVEPDSVSILNLAPAVSRLEDVDSCKSIHESDRFGVSRRGDI